MKHPRVIVAAVAAGLAAPLLLWLGVAATAGGSDQAQSADPVPQGSVSAPSAGSLESQAAGGDRVTPVVEPSAVPTLSARPDPLAATTSPTPRPNTPNATIETPIPEATAAPSAGPSSETSPEAAPPSTSKSPKATPTPTAETTPQPAKTPEPTPSRTPSRAPSPQPETTPKPADRPERPDLSERPERPERIKTTPQRGWNPPQLTAGVNQLSFPVLTSGADVTITVACQPSAGCTMDAGTLTIEPGSSVTVTWSAPRTRTHTAWSVQRTFN